jgi:flagellar hook assembly protein FlgD
MIEVAIFGVRGERVRMLESGNQPVGRYQVTWNGRDDRGRAVATGTYICRLMTAQGSQTRKMVLAR